MKTTRLVHPVPTSENKKQQLTHSWETPDPPPTAPSPQPSQPAGPTSSSPPAAPPPADTTPASSSDVLHHADPDEVDISEHYYAPQTTNRIPTDYSSPGGGMSEDQLRRMMLGFDPAGRGMGMDGTPGTGTPGADDEDPMMKMLQQMMGGAVGGPGGGGGNPFAAFGGGGSSPFGAGTNPFAPPPGQPAVVVTDRYAAVWRLLHTAVALGLGLYIALCTSFAGTKLQRAESSATGSITGRTTTTKGMTMDAGGEGEQDKFDSSRFFWAFATAEAVLLTTRYFLDRARAAAPATGGGVLALAVGFLPPPFKGYVELALRYAQVFSTVRSDVLVCVFVLGVCSWARG